MVMYFSSNHINIAAVSVLPLSPIQSDETAVLSDEKPVLGSNLVST